MDGSVYKKKKHFNIIHTKKVLSTYKMIKYGCKKQFRSVLFIIIKDNSRCNLHFM